MEKICKHHVKGVCTKNPCSFTHVDNVCKHHYFGTCRRGDSCKQSHQYTLQHKPKNTDSFVPSHPYKLQNKLQNKPKNTESFVPSHKPADMRIMLGSGKDYKYPHVYHSRDVMIVPDLFSELFSDLGDVYTTILREMKERDNVWKLWHGDSHWIADDHMKWKHECPTFLKIIDILAAYFKMEVKATRLNWYRDTSEWKPYHHDAAAVDEKKAKTQNLTIGVSFGGTRDASFEHASTKTTVNIPLSNGMTYGFGSQVNIEWRHGIPQVKEVKQEGRISIIAWGWADMTD